MYGYVIANRQELRLREDKLYRGVYCGLCHALGRKYGLLARLLLSYDVTFLAMLFLGDDQGERCHRRCPVHGFRREEVCCGGPGLEAAVDETIILSWWKMRDGAIDDGWRGKLLWSVFFLLFRRAYRKAAARMPEFDRAVSENLERLQDLERANSPSLDETADTFAQLMSASAPLAANEITRRIWEQILYHLGRWVYLVDAWDDLEKDLRTNCYNPLCHRFVLQEGKLSPPDEERLRATLKHSRNLACSAFALLPQNSYTSIVENILTQGMPLVEEAVAQGIYQKKRMVGRQPPLAAVNRNIQQ